MSESDAMNIVVSDITTVKFTKSKGSKVHYHKYQRRLYKFSGFLRLARKKCQTSILVYLVTFKVNPGSQKAEEHSKE